jgi:hypothetical protein
MPVPDILATSKMYFNEVDRIFALQAISSFVHVSCPLRYLKMSLWFRSQSTCSENLQPPIILMQPDPVPSDLYQNSYQNVAFLYASVCHYRHPHLKPAYTDTCLPTSPYLPVNLTGSSRLVAAPGLNSCAMGGILLLRLPSIRSWRELGRFHTSFT